MRKKHNFEVGQLIDDIKLIEYIPYSKETRSEFFVGECIKCGRRKRMAVTCLTRHSGTTHSACGKGIKTKDCRFNSIWCGMKSRIYNPSYEHYDRYGGRGLTTDYDVFIDFYDDMYESYKEALVTIGPDISLDRIDNNKGYIRGNLRWANQKTQVNNSCKMRKLVGISPEGKLFYVPNMRDFAAEHGLSDSQIQAVASGRFKTTLGWRFEYIDDLSRYVHEVYNNE